MPYVKELTGGSGIWMARKVDDSSNVRFTPAYVEFECDNMLMIMDREPIDRDDVTALVYMSMKPTDYAAHRWGLGSLEAREALRAQDACVGSLIQKLNARVDEGNYMVTITAEHGMMPMPELTGGHRLSLRTLLETIDKKFGAKIGLGGWVHQSLLRPGEDEGARHHARGRCGIPPLADGRRLLRSSREVAGLPGLPAGRASLLQRVHFEQVEAFVKANPSRWMANPYAGATAVTLEHDLQQ